ncbi:CYP707A2 [Symbiodinium natans]|uniref:CYP707A2 protein n=1 Tax=Symbiodinium natans TaxID=878477 RepID=A0A812SYI8_9DINO|nr:CYP707A2 [Symbiodinium natans]
MAEIPSRPACRRPLLQVLLIFLALGLFRGVGFVELPLWPSARTDRTLHPLPAVRRAALPIIGDTMQLLNPKTMASYQVDSRSKFGPVWQTSVLFKKAVVVTGARELAEAMRQESRPKATKAFFPPHHQKLFGPQSLLMQSGPPHTKLRRLIQAAMIPKAVSSYQENIDEGVKEFLSKVKSQTGQFSMVETLRSAVVTTMLKILFGTQASSSDITSLIKDVSIWSTGLLSPPLTFIPWSNAARALRARARVADVIRGWLKSCGEEDGTLLSRLVYAQDEDGASLTEQEIIDNVFTLVFAATDTTASIFDAVWTMPSGFQ